MNGQKKKMRFLARIISMLLVLILVSEEFLGSGNIVLAAETEETIVVEEETDADSNDLAETEDDLSEEIDTENLDILFEMEEKRDQSGKHYRLSDGSIMAAEYGMDIHYEDDGQWKDIDNRFVYEAPTEEDSMEGFATAEGDIEFKFAPDTADGEVVRAEYEGYSVSFEFLGENTQQDPGSEDNTGVYSAEEQISVTGETLTENESGQISMTEDISSVPVTFVKGDILNMEEAEAALKGTVAEASIAALEEAEVQEIQAVAGLLAVGGDTLEENSIQEETVWAEVGTEGMDESENDTLMKQAALEHAVTSVGYENVLPDISLQYVVAGSSLKEYILVSEPQDTYEYMFALNLEALIPAMQTGGNILLLDSESGEPVYEIPAAYMTDSAGAYSDAVEMEIERTSEGNYLLKITADKEWIDSGERVFPVKIDPTLNKLLSSTSNIRGNYVRDAVSQRDVASANYGEMYVGYDSSVNGNMTTYIQLRNLETLPKDSVICAAMFNMAVLSYSQVAWPKLYIQAKEVTAATTWSSKYTYNTRPATSSAVLDHRAVTADSVGKYVAWNITELVKKHYDEGNVTDDIFAFSLEAYGTMSNSKCANTALNLLWDGAEPVLQIMYRDTRGVEDYYSYQNQSVGNAGTAYVGDYTSQLTVVKPLVSYNSTSMPYELGIVYNTAYSDGYFTNGGDVHSKNFSNMVLGRGWKLTVQETVVPISITDMESTTTRNVRILWHSIAFHPCPAFNTAEIFFL